MSGPVATFVWLRSQRGPEPQKWYDQFVGAAALEDRVIARHRITAAQATLTLDQLAELHPAPAS